jgi:hypothetical protein
VVEVPNRAGSRVPRVGEAVEVGWLADNGIVFAGAGP